MASHTSSTKDFGTSSMEQTKDAANKAGEKTKEAASSVGDMVSNAASAVGSTVGKTADKLTSATGSGVRHLGETIREKGPQQGMFGNASRAVADTLQEGGKYLEQEGFGGMVDDVAGLIRRNPLPAVLVGLGIGFLIGRTLGS